MTKIIALFNFFGSKCFPDYRWMERNDLGQLPEEVKTGKFEPEPLSDEELDKLAKEIQGRFQKQVSDFSQWVLGSADFLPFKFLQQGWTAGKAVCCLLKTYNDSELDEIVKLAKKDEHIRGAALKWFVDPGRSIDLEKEADRAEFKRQATGKPVPCGTGFLVGARYLLTNLHVVENKDRLSHFSAAFGYEGDLKGAEIYDFDREFWADNKELDYVLLKLKPRGDREVGAKFTPLSLKGMDSVRVVPWLRVEDVEKLHQKGQLSEQERNQLLELMQKPLQGKKGIGDFVNIIQHPEGRSKEIAIFDNQLQELYQDFLVYTTDAQPGSSGSPLFNSQWELIGLHQAALLEQNESDVPGESSFRVKGYLGIRMSSILADLRKTDNDEIKAFLNAIDRAEPTPTPSPPPDLAEPTPTPSPSPPRQTGRQVFILAGRDRSRVLPKDFAALEQKAMLKLQAQVAQALNQLDPSIKIQLIEGSGTDLESAIDRINLKAAESGDTQSAAIELLVDEYSDAKIGGISAYYCGGKPRRKEEANALLNAIRIKGIPIFGIGAYSDRVTGAGRLEFCRDTTMPAFVLYAGYLSNPDDRARLEALGTEISPLAQGIAAGLLAWLQRIH